MGQSGALWMKNVCTQLLEKPPEMLHLRLCWLWYCLGISRNQAGSLGLITPPFLTQFSSVAQSRLTLCNPMDCSTQASLSTTNSQSLLKLMSIETLMPSNHLILCHPLLLLPSIFPSIRVFSNESDLHIRWPEY